MRLGIVTRDSVFMLLVYLLGPGLKRHLDTGSHQVDVLTNRVRRPSARKVRFAIRSMRVSGRKGGHADLMAPAGLSRPRKDKLVILREQSGDVRVSGVCAHRSGRGHSCELETGDGTIGTIDLQVI